MKPLNSKFRGYGIILPIFLGPSLPPILRVYFVSVIVISDLLWSVHERTLEKGYVRFLI